MPAWEVVGEHEEMCVGWAALSACPRLPASLSCTCWLAHPMLSPHWGHPGQAHGVAGCCHEACLPADHGCTLARNSLRLPWRALCRYRKRHKHIDSEVLKHWAWQILCGLVYLHGHEPSIIHR